MNRDVEHSGQTLETSELCWGSDLVAWTLRNLPIDHIALNPGASYRGLHDSLVNLLHDQNPDMFVCLHEEHAVAIAHGYAKVLERPMAVAVHSNVGLMHATMAIYNAWCDRAPIVILGATGPVDANKRRPWIDWIHTSQDQGALVRSYVKWDDQPGSPQAAMESVARGYQLSSRAPKGPVYICLDVGMQEQRLTDVPSLPDLARFQPADAPAATDESIKRLAGTLKHSTRIVILAGRVSRDPEAWEQRIALAERLGATVLTDLKVAAAFPSKHPLHPFDPAFKLEPSANELLAKADVILSLDWLDLGGTLYSVWPDGKPSATVINISLDDYTINGWSMNHQRMAPIDLPVIADVDQVVAALLPEIECASHVRSTHTAKGKDLPALHDPLDMGGLAALLHDHFGNTSVSWLRFPLGWATEYCDLRHPLDYLGYDGGAGVGSGPGIAIGAALALKGSDRLPIAVLGDGDVMMAINALWTAARHDIPLLIVVANNQAYFNDVAHQEAVAVVRNRDTENKWVGQKLDRPPIDIPAMARAQGWFAGDSVATGAELVKALPSAVAAVNGATRTETDAGLCGIW